MKRLPWILFLLSLCFNVFFLYGFLQSRRQLALAQTKEGGTQLMFERLGLNPKQKEAFEKIQADTEVQIQRYRAANVKRGEDFWAEVGKDAPELDAVMDKLQVAEVGHNEGQRSRISGLLEVLKLLEPQQRTLYLRIIRQRNIFAQ